MHRLSTKSYIPPVLHNPPTLWCSETALFLRHHLCTAGFDPVVLAFAQRLPATSMYRRNHTLTVNQHRFCNDAGAPYLRHSICIQYTFIIRTYVSGK